MNVLIVEARYLSPSSSVMCNFVTSNDFHRSPLLSEFLFKKILFNVYLLLRERERERASEQGRGRETGKQNPKQAPGSELSAKSQTQGSNS